jgi:pyrimidine operon attenuation protein/uracil phosphoribosyltransferase
MSKEPTLILTARQINQKLVRMAHEIHENHYKEKELVLVGVTGRGMQLATRLSKLMKDVSEISLHLEEIELNKEKPLSSPPHYSGEMKKLKGKSVVLVDDVLFTGRTIRAGIEALLEYGRPEKIDLLVLINRKFSRELPIEPLMIGKSVDHYDGQKVRVVWKSEKEKESQVLLQQENNG